ncbi:MAG: uroporphyrinogen-III synthase [Gemmatimonadaceae bacterium]
MIRPLAGRRVVVTRFEPDDGPLATALRRAGAEPVVVPLIGIAPLAADVPDANRSIQEFDWIAFTSANGVRIFWARLSESEQSAFRIHRGIASVGPATARAIANLGATSALVAPEFVAESLADALGDVHGKSILWPRAAGARSVLSATLRQRGATVTDQILYDTVALTIPERTRESILEADAITFTSPSAVRAFVASFGTGRRPLVVCIGPVTADAARAAGLNVTAVAGIFTLDGLVSALTDALARDSGPMVRSLDFTRA